MWFMTSRYDARDYLCFMGCGDGFFFLFIFFFLFFFGYCFWEV